MSTDPTREVPLPAVSHGEEPLPPRQHRMLTGIAVLALILIVGYIGMFGLFGLNRVEQIAMTILTIAAIAWFTEILPLFVTGLLVLLLALVWLQPTMNAISPISPEVFTAPFFSDIILLYLGGFVISRALEQEDLTLRMVQGLLRYGGKTTPVLLLSAMSITALASLWLSNTSTTVMMLAIMSPMLGRLPYSSQTRKAFLLGIPFAANFGGLGTPVGTPPNAIVASALREIGRAPDFLTWMWFGVPSVIILVLITWLLLLFSPGVGRDAIPALKTEAVKPYSSSTWVVLIVSLLTVFGWLTSDYHGIKPGTISLLPCIIFFGAGFLPPNMVRTLSWDVLLLMGGGLCLGEVIGRSGLAKR